MGKCSDGRTDGPAVNGKPVTECKDLSEGFGGCSSAFGGAYCGGFYEAMKAVMKNRIPLVVTCAGPITVSRPASGVADSAAEGANTAYITVTDAICYHDGHDCLRKTAERPIREVALFGDDAELRRTA